MAKTQHPKLRKELDVVFISPFATHQWQSTRGREHWCDLELWQDAMAGPLVSIADFGGCNYVFDRNDGYFKGVVDPTSLHVYLLECYESLHAAIEVFCPSSSDEAADQTYMRSIAAKMRVVLERGYQIEYARWAGELR